MLDVLPLAFSALRNLSFIIDTKISIKQCYNHTTIREYLFIYFSRLKYQNEIYVIIAMKILWNKPNCI